MPQVDQRLGLDEEAIDILLCKRRTKDFQRGMTFQIDMLTEVDVGEASPSKLAENTVIPELLSDPVSHHSSPEHSFFSRYFSLSHASISYI